MIRILVNEAMRVERQSYLGASPYERTPERRGCANGFKTKKVKTRVGEIAFDIPQVRGGGFYPGALEKGLRSERALTLTLAEMYVQGVSTRKVSAITEQLCGTSVSSTQVSRAASLLDEVLEAWRRRPMGEVIYLYLDARYEKVRMDGQIRAAAILIASGVGKAGKRQILGLSVSLSEVEDPDQGRSALADLSQEPCCPGHAGRALGNQRRSHRAGSRTSVGAGRCPMAAMPIPPAAECGQVCSPQIHAQGSGGRHPNDLPWSGSSTMHRIALRQRLI
jgi:transposase-like protein